MPASNHAKKKHRDMGVLKSAWIDLAQKLAVFLYSTLLNKENHVYKLKTMIFGEGGGMVY